MLQGFRWKSAQFAGDFRPRGPGLSLCRIVVPRGVSRKPPQAGHQAGTLT
jgi:hypothetical protein